MVTIGVDPHKEAHSAVATDLLGAPSLSGQRATAIEIRHSQWVDPIARAFAPLIGLRCWNVECGYGSFLTMEFGKPRIESLKVMAMPLQVGSTRPKAPRRTTYVRGDWHLWIYCCFWRLLWEDQEVLFCETDRHDMTPALAHMTGALFESIDVNPENGSSRFTFDLGWVLETHPYESATSTERLGIDVADDGRAKGPTEQWHLYEPQATVLSVDNHGTVSHESAASKPDEPTNGPDRND